MTRKQSGFTLLEVLVALTLMGLLMGILFSGFKIGLKNWQVAEEHTARVEEPRQLSNLLYRHFSQLISQIDNGSGEYVQTDFLAGANEISYVSPLSISTGNQPYAFQLYSEAGKTGIWIRYRPITQDMLTESLIISSLLREVKPIRLSDKVSVHFEYYVDGEWKENLERRHYPPLLRVTFEGNETIWPQLTYSVNRVAQDIAQ